jgi:hypothetical protein
MWDIMNILRREKQDTAMRLQYSISKLQFLIGRLLSTRLQAMCVECKLLTLRYAPRMEAEIL